MAGKKKFSSDEVTLAILEVFSEKGFSGTSVTDLEKATGLNRSSLYNTFGNKHKIFLQSLEIYRSTVERRLLKSLENPKLICALEALFEAQLDELAHQKLPTGCLTTNACTEIGCCSSDVDTAIGDTLTEIEVAIFDRLLNAQEADKLKASADIKALARFFTGVSRAIPLMYRATRSIEYARDIAMTSLLILNADILDRNDSKTDYPGKTEN
ncbi:MAG: TetR/AcrR family transcriptional regulator [Cyanobacteria bacterium P01_A01_bin.40]